MATLTKQDIDGLVDGLPDDRILTFDGLRRHLYLAAGLNADGSEKAKAVRCWYTVSADGLAMIYDYDPGFCGDGVSVTAGWFTPDGAA